mmetsp:Transcript_28599/g.43759  ORF Transcript_28599/g.43759 Transcript_28599/m.43759 type:complete len:86 (-) Transcript_28599:102-359(-)
MVKVIEFVAMMVSDQDVSLPASSILSPLVGFCASSGDDQVMALLFRPKVSVYVHHYLTIVVVLGGASMTILILSIDLITMTTMIN